MGTFHLTPHGDTPPVALDSLSLTWMGMGNNRHLLRYVLEEPPGLLLPPLAAPRRADNLWRATCFELFLRLGQGPGYVEYNFSPSCTWAAYSFTAYRQGMAEYPVAQPPVIGMSRFGTRFELSVGIEGLPANATFFGASAVIEELEEGQDAADEDAATRLSYWAHTHWPAKPDFHHPTCMALPVPAPLGA